ncbi:hypothetical protein [Saccharopolyspora sp. ASAGF58]|uniref:hypothetical protein n=1 Tax=Saccharopolyspora sp. ASAGF58 TaxID=2719023 RepID=UPI00144888A9|nr:hypothetical protein [Saccharopolyspora sp. ASAGF58]
MTPTAFRVRHDQVVIDAEVESDFLPESIAAEDGTERVAISREIATHDARRDGPTRR